MEKSPSGNFDPHHPDRAAEVADHKLVAGLRDKIDQLEVEVENCRRGEALMRVQRDLGIDLLDAENPRAAARAFSAAAARLDGVDLAGLFLLRRDHRGWNLVWVEGQSEECGPTAHLLAQDPAAVGALAEGASLRLTARQLRLTYGDEFSAAGLVMVGLLPVSRGGAPLAALMVGSRRVERLPAAAWRALESMAVQVGGAIGRLNPSFREATDVQL